MVDSGELERCVCVCGTLLCAVVWHAYMCIFVCNCLGACVECTYLWVCVLWCTILCCV